MEDIYKPQMRKSTQPGLALPASALFLRVLSGEARDVSRCLRITLIALLIFGYVIAPAQAQTAYQRQIIKVPIGNTPGAGELRWRFAAVDGDGKADLIVLSAAEDKAWIYRQSATGFPSNANQILTLPPKCGWLAACDVDPQPGRELVLSTATGLYYLRQTNGLFEDELRMLARGSQPFTAETTPSFVLLPGQREKTNVVIPLLAGTNAVLYQRHAHSLWQPGAQISLALTRSSWGAEPDGWMFGSSPAHSLTMTEQF